MWPSKTFIRAFIEKFLSLLVSVKMLIIALSGYLTYIGKLEGLHFSTIVCTIGVVKMGTDMITIYKRKEVRDDEEIRP